MSFPDISSNEIKKDIDIDDFRLPITYLNNNELYPIANNVSDDLELYNESDTNIYHTLFKPNTKFSQYNIKYWNKYYTDNIVFLKDSQHIITNLSIYKNKSFDDYDFILDLWKETKNDSNFYIKYNYLDWDMLKQFNNYAPLLLMLAIFNIATPILFFLTPLIIIIIPFIILKYQGIPISINLYISILKDIFNQQILGKFYNSNNNFGKQFALLYLFGCIIFFFIQVYSNFKTCYDFYKNIKHVNNNIIKLNKFFQFSLENMDKFKQISNKCNSYKPFCDEIEKNQQYLSSFLNNISFFITDFDHSPRKILEFGNILQVYYHIHSDPNIEKAMQFSIGFDGYIDNLYSIHNLYNNGHLAIAKFTNLSKQHCNIKKQVYPSLYDSNERVDNDIDLSSNAIITGPNASGKTTTIKTTIINVILSQQFGLGFYKSCTLNPYKFIHSYINIPDTNNRDSLFQAESRRCKDIIDIILANSKDRHLCIFDELYSGTNPDEAPKAGYSFLKYLNTFKNVNLILTTHYSFICKKFKKSKRISNYQMNVIQEEQDHKFTYKLVDGISQHKGAIKILKDMDYPEEIIKTFEKI